jgi:hypothetical protein
MIAMGDIYELRQPAARILSAGRIPFSLHGFI